MSEKYCKDCANYSEHIHDKVLAIETFCRISTGNNNLVSGEPLFEIRHCHEMRQIGRQCGPHAILFEPRK